MFKKVLRLIVTVGFALSVPFAANAAMVMHHGMPKGADGATYTGPPDLKATAALLAAGGGAGKFSIRKALTSMAGPSVVAAELRKLKHQYGEKAIARWIEITDYSTNEAAVIAASEGVSLPAPPAELTRHALARRLIHDGLSSSDVYFNGIMLDHLLSHKIHAITMDAIDSKYSPTADGMYHRITNQAMYDLAIALGATNVHLAFYH